MAPKKQADKFKDLARELECDEDEKAFEEKLRQVAKPEARLIHASDCAMHNAPAFKAGACDCGASTTRR